MPWKGGDARTRPGNLRREKLGKPLGLSAEDAAGAVIRIANAKMAGAIRMVSMSLGADPRDFALFAFGGAGPLHAAALARELGVPRVLVPARPGITNALGCVVADLRHDFVNTINQPLDTADMDRVHEIFARQATEGRALIEQENVEIARSFGTLQRRHAVRRPDPSAAGAAEPRQADSRGTAAPVRGRLFQTFPGRTRRNPRQSGQRELLGRSAGAPASISPR